MDYHSDRFDDFSLMIYQGEELIGLLPANRKEDILHSHQGLTYGGLFFDRDIKFDEVFKSICVYIKDNGINRIEFRTLPDIYQREHSRAFVRFLQDSSTPVFHTNKILAIDYSLPLKIHKTKLKHFRKNSTKEFEIKEENSCDLFWNEVLMPRLSIKHNTKPVHSLDEINLLKSRFIKQIKQYNIYLKGQIMAGITIFDKGDVIKSQYGATNEIGESERALEYLFIELIKKYKADGKRFFSMGTVMDNTFSEGYNKGLMRQKIELGCREYKQDFYRYKVL